jgi:hypothetical protein
MSRTWVAVAGAPRSCLFRHSARRSSGVISVRSLFFQTGTMSRSKMTRRIDRVLSAIGASSNQRSPNWAKLRASLSRRFSRCFSWAGDRPSATARRASRHFSRARAREMPASP